MSRRQSTGGGSRSGAATPDASAATNEASSAGRPSPYDFKPPPWRPRLHPTQPNPGVPDVFPTRLGQPEDTFNHATVRSGFQSSFGITNETLLSHEIVGDLVQSDQLLANLDLCLEEVLVRRDAIQRDRIAASQHKAPSRVTLNDLKLATYVKDLADPTVPLHRLSRSVPHGFKGERMFEMLWSGGASASTTSVAAGGGTGSASGSGHGSVAAVNRAQMASRVAAAAAAASSTPNPNAGGFASTAASTPTGGSPGTPLQAPFTRSDALPSSALQRSSVDISRAVWFVRAVGAAEIQSVRSKTSATYATEMTGSLCAWLNKQMAELSLAPSSAAPGAGPSGGTPAATFTAVSPATPSPGYFQQRATPINPAGHQHGHHSSRPPPPGTPLPWQHPASAAHAPTSSSAAAVGVGDTQVRDYCAVLSNEADAERWLAKWSYSLSLVRHLNAEHLVDRTTLYRWIMDALSGCNIVQVWFLIELVQEIAQLVVQRRELALLLASALCSRLSSLDDSRFDPDAVNPLRSRLREVLLFVLEHGSDTFVSPRLWHDHRRTIIAAVELGCATDTQRRARLDGVVERIEDRIGTLSLSSYVDALQCDVRTTSTTEGTGMALFSPSRPRGTAHAVEALDAMDLDAPAIDRLIVGALGAVEPSRSGGGPVADRVDVILTWACTSWRRGIHRQYVAASLIERIKYGETSARGGSAEGSSAWGTAAVSATTAKRRSSKVNVEPALLKWLTDVEAALSADASAHDGSDDRTRVLASCEPSAIIVAFGELARRGLFSYSRFLQRLVARGMTMQAAPQSGSDEGLAASSTPGAQTARIEVSAPLAAPAPMGDAGSTALAAGSSKAHQDTLQLRLLRSLPLFEETPAIIQQRRVAIYGQRTKETHEEATERRALRELALHLPWVFDGSEVANGPSDADKAGGTAAVDTESLDEDSLASALPHLWSASRYVRVKLLRTQILPRAATLAPEVLTSDRICVLAAVLVRAEDCETLLQLMVSLLLQGPLQDSVAKVIFDLLIEHHRVWRGLDALQTLALLVRQQLNHASSTRSVRLALLASNALKRLRDVQAPARQIAPEAGQATSTSTGPPVSAPLPPSPHASVGPDPSEITMCQQVFRRLALGDGPEGRMDGTYVLAQLRRLFTRADSTVDEAIEFAVVDCLTESVDLHLIELAIELVDLLHREATTEVDERHARWQAMLAYKLGHPGTSPSVLERLLTAILRLAVLGAASLAVVVRNLLLPLVSNLTQAVADPSNASAPEAGPLLLRCAAFLSRTLLLEVGVNGASAPPSPLPGSDADHPSTLGFSLTLGSVSSLTCSERQSLRAQRAIMLSSGGFEPLVRLLTLLQIASQASMAYQHISGPPSPASAVSMPSPAPPPAGLRDGDDHTAFPLGPIELVVKGALALEGAQTAYRRDPRAFFRAVRSTVKKVWGCDGRKVLDDMLASLDPSSLLLIGDLGSIGGQALRRRFDGWHSATLACELVDIFDRLQTAEPSFQVRAESRIRALASELHRDLFIDDPSAGRSLLEDAASAQGLSAKFLDEGLRMVLRCSQHANSSRTQATTDTQTASVAPLTPVGKAALHSQARRALGSAANGASAPGEPRSTTSSEPPAATPPRNDDLLSAVKSIAAIESIQTGFAIVASDSEAASQLFQLAVDELEAAATANDVVVAQQAIDGLGLLHLLLRVNCLWTSTSKAQVGRLISSLLSLCQLLGIHTDHEPFFELALDTLGFALDEAPSAVLTPLAADVDRQVEDMRYLHPRAASRMRLLLRSLDTAAAGGGTRDLVLTPHAATAMRRGWYTTGAIKPWECLEYIEPLASASALARTSGMGSPASGVGGGFGPASMTVAAAGGASGRGVPPASRAVAGRKQADEAAAVAAAEARPLPGARTGWPTKLATNTSLPLSLFGGRVTRDVVPTFPRRDPADAGSADATPTGPPAHVESERSYGEQRSGEPIFARDLRRGLVEFPLALAPATEEGGENDDTEEAQQYRRTLTYWGDVGSTPVSAPQGRTKAKPAAAERVTIDLTLDDEEEGSRGGRTGDAGARGAGAGAGAGKTKKRKHSNAAATATAAAAGSLHGGGNGETGGSAGSKRRR